MQVWSVLGVSWSVPSQIYFQLKLGPPDYCSPPPPGPSRQRSRAGGELVYSSFLPFSEVHSVHAQHPIKVLVYSQVHGSQTLLLVFLDMASALGFHLGDPGCPGGIHCPLAESWPLCWVARIKNGFRKNRLHRKKQCKWPFIKIPVILNLS